MTKSCKSVFITVRLDFHGYDVSRDSIEQALHNMDYEFSYDDDYLSLINSEIVDTFSEEIK